MASWWLVRGTNQLFRWRASWFFTLGVFWREIRHGSLINQSYCESPYSTSCSYPRVCAEVLDATLSWWKSWQTAHSIQKIHSPLALFTPPWLGTFVWVSCCCMFGTINETLLHVVVTNHIITGFLLFLNREPNSRPFQLTLWDRISQKLGLDWQTIFRTRLNCAMDHASDVFQFKRLFSKGRKSQFVKNKLKIAYNTNTNMVTASRWYIAL